MMPDFVTIDAFARPTGGRSHWRRNRRHSEAGGITAPAAHVTNGLESSLQSTNHIPR
jgi:hypothetical protein